MRDTQKASASAVTISGTTRESFRAVTIMSVILTPSAGSREGRKESSIPMMAEYTIQKTITKRSSSFMEKSDKEADL